MAAVNCVLRSRSLSAASSTAWQAGVLWCWLLLRLSYSWWWFYLVESISAIWFSGNFVARLIQDVSSRLIHWSTLGSFTGLRTLLLRKQSSSTLVCLCLFNVMRAEIVIVSASWPRIRDQKLTNFLVEACFSIDKRQLLKHEYRMSNRRWSVRLTATESILSKPGE